MDFARKQLEKYGWSDGKGLGKNENGISEALKPKLKRSVTGIGYDAAQDLTDHWWSALYDKAASNVEVEEKNGKTKKMKQKDDEFEITNSTWKLQKKSKNKDEKEYCEFFIKTEVIDTGGTKTTKVTDSDSDDDGNNDDKKAVTITDEELFAACQGRTAHKGARHGLRALGKLARIEQQEKLLLQQTRYEGYSHSKMIQKSSIDDVVENTNLNSDTENKVSKKKKRRCNNNDTSFTEIVETAVENKKKSKTKYCINNVECNDLHIENVCDESHDKYKKKSKKRKDCRDDMDSSDFDKVENDSGDANKRKKKSKKEVDVPMVVDIESEESDKPKKKKKKN